MNYPRITDNSFSDVSRLGGGYLTLWALRRSLFRVTGLFAGLILEIGRILGLKDLGKAFLPSRWEAHSYLPSMGDGCQSANLHSPSPPWGHLKLAHVLGFALLMGCDSTDWVVEAKQCFCSLPGLVVLYRARRKHAEGSCSPFSQDPKQN